MHLALALEGDFTDDGAGWTLAALAAVVGRAEELGVDFVLLPDTIAASPARSAWPDATLLLAWLAASTRSIGLVCTASTLRFEPYTLARRFASLDLISRGRIGWRLPLKLDPAEQASYSAPRRITQGDLAERAEEFTTIVKGLWAGWDEDALLFDKPAGRFFDPAKMRHLDHTGANFSVRGPLNVPRSPQGAPLLVVEPQEEAETDFAARHADLIILDVSASLPNAPQAKTMARIAPRSDAGSTLIAPPAQAAAWLEALAAERGYAGFVFPAPSPRDAAALMDGLLPKLGRGGHLTPSPGHATLRVRLRLVAGATA